MKNRPGRGILGGSMARRFALLTTLGCGLLAVGVPVASARTAAVSFNGCTSATFTYTDFGANNPITVQETVTKGATTVATKSFSFTPAAAGDTQTDTVPLPGLTNGEVLVGKATITSGGSGSYTSPAHTVTGCAVTYTGRAFDLYAAANVLGLTLAPTYINDSGSLASPNPINESNTVLTATIGSLVNAGVASQSVTASSDASMASATITGAAVSALSLGLNATAVASASLTTCNASTNAITTSGSTTITNLVINGASITLPNPIPVDYMPVNLGLLGTVTLNEQIKTASGLVVNAIDIKLLGGAVQVIIGSSESDVEGC